MLKTVSTIGSANSSNGTVTSVGTGTGLTGGPITSTGTISIANTAVTAGVYGNATTVSQVTINAQGQITNAANVAITFPAGGVTNVATGTGLTGGPITSTGTISIANTTVTAGVYGGAANTVVVTINSQGQITAAANSVITLPNSGVTAGIYGNATTVSQVTVNAQGLVTAAANVSISSAVGANPSASFTGVAINGVATTFMRSDAAPAIGKLTANLIFTDATYDIGASGATRPRDFFLSRNAVIGGTINVTGHTTFEGVTSTGATGTGSLVYSASPTFTGTVNGAAAIWSGNNTAAAFIPSSATVPTNGMYLIAANTLGFAINGAEAARFDTSANLLIGRTATVNNARIAVQSGADCANFYTTATGVQCAVCRIDNTGSNFLTFNYAGSGVGTINTNGTITVYNTTSDERQKDWNIPQIDYRKQIESLWVGDFNKWTNTDKKGDSAPSFGVRAQQAYKTLGDISGIVPPLDPTKQWYAPSEPFGYLALWAAKDIYALIAGYEARIAALEAKVK